MKKKALLDVLSLDLFGAWTILLDLFSLFMAFTGIW